MIKKNVNKRNITAAKDACTDKRREILDLCYNRLKEMIPECTSEVNLLKCIEILEKKENSLSEDTEQKALCAIADTLDRLAGLR